MPVTRQRFPLEGHPISPERARELIAGPMGDTYREILKNCCAPVFWYHNSKTGPLEICDSGTVTFVDTGEMVLGITAAHIVDGVTNALAMCDVTAQIMDAPLERLSVIDIDRKLDLATIALEQSHFDTMGKVISPLMGWPPVVPEEGRGIMLAGYPGADRIVTAPNVVDWGLCTILGIARRVTDEQITWLLEREHGVTDGKIPDLPPNHMLGGISGGPLIGWFETPSGFTYPTLCAIISEASAQFENVIAKRADFIRADGKIGN